MSSEQKIQLTFDPKAPWDMPDELFNKLVSERVIVGPLSNRIMWNEICRKLADPEYTCRAKLIDKATRRYAQPGSEFYEVTKDSVINAISRIIDMSKGDGEDAGTSTIFDDMLRPGSKDRIDLYIKSLTYYPELSVDI